MALINRRRPTKAAPATPASAKTRGLDVADLPYLTAAAQPMGASKTTGGSSNQSTAWKTDAWDYYDRVGELRFVCAWIENNLSRVALVASDIDPTTGHPTGSTDDQLAIETVADIAGGPAGQAQLLGRLATFLTVPGEGWIAIIHRTDETDVDELGGVKTWEEWHVLSEDEIKRKGQTVEIVLPDGTKYEIDPDQDTIERIYRPHPRRAVDSDSPVRAALPILREIVRMGQNIEGAGKSRNAGNGLLLLPKEMSMPTGAQPTAEAPPPADPDAPDLPPPPPPPVEVRVTANDVMLALKTAMETAIKEPDSAAALMPILLSAPGEHLKNVRHITFQSELTNTSLEVRKEAIRRLALSLDTPAEVLLGMGDVNHWGAWAIDESGIKVHIVPLMTIICDALTVAVFRPMLKLLGHPDPDSLTLWFDPSGLTLRPNRAEDAKDAVARGAITLDAYRRELGFSDEDALPTDPKSLALWAFLTNPDLASTLGPMLGLQVPDTRDVSKTTDAGDDVGAEPIPDTKDDAEVKPLRVAALMAAQRLMEVSGKRRRTRGNTPELAAIPTADTHRALGGTTALTRVLRDTDLDQVRDAATMCGAKPDAFVTLVDTAVRRAITAGHACSQIRFTDQQLRQVI